MKTKTYWFALFRKVVPADFEAWLEQLASEGWNVDKLGQISSMKMTFHKTEPKKYRYVFDLNAFKVKDYKRTYEQFGWEFVGQMSNCFVWRQEYTDTRPESFTDSESLVRRNKRVRNAIIGTLMFFIAGIITGLVGIGVCAAIGRQEKILEIVFTVLFMSAFSTYLAWVIRQINKNLDR
jgi:hypothetical protein